MATTPIVVAVPGSTGAGRRPAASVRMPWARPRPSSPRAPAITSPCASKTSPIAFTATSAPTVSPSTHSDAVPMPPRIARSKPNSLPTLAPQPAPKLPCSGGAVLAASQAAWPVRRAGADARVAEPEVEQHRGRDDGHARRAHGQAMPVLVEPAHHAAGGVEPERAAAGEQHGMHAVDGALGPQQIGLARARGAAANRHPADHALRAEHDGAAGGAPAFRGVADGEPGHVGQGAGVEGERVHRSRLSGQVQPARCDAGYAKTPAVSCIAALTSPR